MEIRALFSNETGEFIAVVSLPAGSPEDYWNYVLNCFPDALWGDNYLNLENG